MALDDEVIIKIFVSRFHYTKSMDVIKWEFPLNCSMLDVNFMVLKSVNCCSAANGNTRCIFLAMLSMK